MDLQCLCFFFFFLFDSSIVTVRCQLQRNAQVSCIQFSPFKGNGMCSQGGLLAGSD